MTNPKDIQIAEFVGGLDTSGKLGEGINKLYEEAMGQTHSHNGAKRALAELAKKLASVHRKADEEQEAGNWPDPQTYGEVKRYVTLCAEAARNLAMYYEAQESVAHGRADAYSRCIKISQNFHDVAANRIRQLQAPPEEPTEDAKTTNGKARVKKGRTLADVRAGRGLEPETKKPTKKKATQRKTTKAKPAKKTT